MLGQLINLSVDHNFLSEYWVQKNIEISIYFQPLERDGGGAAGVGGCSHAGIKNYDICM